MAQNDPWAAFRTGPAAQPAPSPPPAQTPAAPRLPYSPAKVQQQVNQERQEERADTRIGVDLNQDARAAEEHAKKMATLEANGGIDTNASQDQAASHAINLETNLRALNDVRRRKPSAMKPGLLEVRVSAITDNPNVLSVVRGGDDGERQIAATALDSSMESLVWLSTGASSTEPQGQRFKSEITPYYGDKEATLRHYELLR